MILYYAISTYQLLNMMVYHRTRNGGKRAVLVIGRGLCKKFNHYAELHDLFDDVWVDDMKPNFASEAEILSYYEDFFASRGHQVEDFDALYVGAAQFFFGIHLAILRRPFYFFEDGAGALSDPGRLARVDRDRNAFKHDLAQQYGLYDGANSIILKRLGNACTQRPEYLRETPNFEDFNVIDAFGTLDADGQAAILSFFRVPRDLTVPKQSVVLMTQHYANLGILSFQEQILLYQMTVDFFFDDRRVIFKPHPDDLVYYEFLFPDALVLREKFPSEFLPLIFEQRPETIATITSSSMFMLEASFAKSVSFDTTYDYEKGFAFLPRYYMTIRILEALGCRTVALIGADVKMFSNLLQKEGFSARGMLKAPEEASVWIVDAVEGTDMRREDIRVAMQSLSKGRSIIFINSRDDYVFYDPSSKAMLEDMVPVCVRKQRIENPEFYGDTRLETIYFYVKDKECRLMINDQEYDKKLASTGLVLRKEKLDEYECRIKMLEGMLKATERRLLECIEQMRKREE